MGKFSAASKKPTWIQGTWPGLDSLQVEYRRRPAPAQVQPTTKRTTNGRWVTADGGRMSASQAYTEDFCSTVLNIFNRSLTRPVASPSRAVQAALPAAPRVPPSSSPTTAADVYGDHFVAGQIFGEVASGPEDSDTDVIDVQEWFEIELTPDGAGGGSANAPVDDGTAQPDFVGLVSASSTGPCCVAREPASRKRAFSQVASSRFGSKLETGATKCIATDLD